MLKMQQKKVYLILGSYKWTNVKRKKFKKTYENGLKKLNISIDAVTKET